MPNGIDLLLADHQTVSELFDAFQDGADSTAVGQILDCLTAHDSAEQAALYPLTIAVLEDASLVERSLQAHSQVKALMEDLRFQEGAALVAAVAALRAAVDEHVQDEEKHLFPALAKAATPQQLEGLAARIEQNKQRVG